ncbi:MAG: leucine-rich repeat domain-containing protein [Sulfuricurvum sp.]|nr:leucine-rich repeat domain-containing protein [Sulfuricurvum sp.]
MNQDQQIQILYDWALAHGLEGMFRKVVGDHAVEMKDISEVVDKTWLSYSRNYTIPYIPDEIVLLQKTTRFQFQKVGLKALPKTLCTLKYIENFSVPSNELTELPSCIGELKHLAYLDARENRISHLPESIGDARSLVMIHMSDNNLSSIPKSIGNLESLDRLFLANNPITELPEELRYCCSLEVLDISNTQIEEIPQWLGEMKSLRSLISDKPFKLYFEKALEQEEYGAMKITFRHRLEQDLMDEELHSQTPFLIGDEGWPMGRAIWGVDERGEHIEYYLNSRWGDTHGKIYKDGTHEFLPVLPQMGKVSEWESNYRVELTMKGLIS